MTVVTMKVVTATAVAVAVIESADKMESEIGSARAADGSMIAAVETDASSARIKA
jgi:hypothetical protein